MLIKNVYLFDGSPLQHLVDIRISGNTIKEVGRNLTQEENEEAIQGKGSIALPGLIDSHRHVWQAPFQSYASDMMLMDYLNKAVGELGSQLTAEDLYTINLYGYLKAAAKGITTIFDWCHVINTPQHGEAAIQAAIDSKINVLFFHSTPATNREALWYNSNVPHDKDIVRLIKLFNHASTRVRIGMGIRGPEFASMDVNREDIELARDLDIPVSMHIGSSVLGKIHQPVLKLAEHGLLGSDLNLVHCNVLGDHEFSLLEEAGCLVSITPEVEMQMGLGNPIADKINALQGLKWSVGLDIVTSAADNLFYQQHLLLQLYRGWTNSELIQNDVLPLHIPYTSSQWFYDSMKHANEFAGFSTSVTITEGAQANLSLVDWSDLEPTFFKQYPSFHYLRPEAVETVIADGRLLVHNKVWLLHDYDKIEAQVQQITERLIKDI